MDEYDYCDCEETKTVNCPECGAYHGEFCIYCGAHHTPDWLAGEIKECDCRPMWDEDESPF